MKVVILGAKGMLGRDLGKVFYDLSPYLLDKDELDVTNEKGTSALFRNLKPDLVINAAAYTDVDGCETNKDLAMKVNADAPGYLARASRDVGAVFVHYSTDYVFDGGKSEGYKEDEEPGKFTRRGGGPLNFYGESKLAGENAVREVGGNYYLIRASWLFGLGGPQVDGRPINFIETILRLAQEKDELKVVNDQHGKPTFSLDLARKTRELVEGKEDFGIYHITNEPVSTWCDFACEIIKGGLAPKSGQGPNVIPCASDEFPRPAKRPRYSILLNTKRPLLRSWQEALAEYLSLRK